MIINALPLVCLLSKPLQLSENTVICKQLHIECSLNGSQHILCFSNKEFPDEPLAYFNANTRSLEYLNEVLKPEIEEFLVAFSNLLDAVKFGESVET